MHNILYNNVIFFGEKTAVVVTRMYFICSRTNVIDKARREKSRLHRKSAKFI